MFCSTIITTIGRETLERAVKSVLSQSIDKDEFEVIVVNDSGKPLIWEDWHSSSQVRIIHTNRHERSIARNTGAAIAKGQYLHFLDDDDWLFPDALYRFWTLYKEHPASLLYGSSQLIDRKGNLLIQLHHGMQGDCFLQVMAGEWIPLQSSLIEAKLFHTLGGFSPNLNGPEDIDLLRRVCLHRNIVETRHLIAYIERGEEGSTTNYFQHPEMSRWAREFILNTQGVFGRLKAGANSSYWYGRFLRIYLTSALWNFLRKQLFIGGSRLVHGIIVILLANFNLFSKDFWDGLIKPYHSPTFERGLMMKHEAS